MCFLDQWSFTQIIALGLGWVAKGCCQAGPPCSPTTVGYHCENGSVPWGSQQSCHSFLPWLGVQQLFTPEFVALVLAGFWGLKIKIYFCTLCIHKNSGRIQDGTERSLKSPFGIEMGLGVKLQGWVWIEMFPHAECSGQSLSCGLEHTIKAKRKTMLLKLLFPNFLPVFLSSVNDFLFYLTPSPALQGSFTMQGSITQVDFSMRYGWISWIVNFLTRNFEFNPGYGIFLVAKKIKRKAAKKLTEVKISLNSG